MSVWHCARDLRALRIGMVSCGGERARTGGRMPAKERRAYNVQKTNTLTLRLI